MESDADDGETSSVMADVSIFSGVRSIGGEGISLGSVDAVMVDATVLTAATVCGSVSDDAKADDVPKAAVPGLALPAVGDDCCCCLFTKSL